MKVMKISTMNDLFVKSISKFPISHLTIMIACNTLASLALNDESRNKHLQNISCNRELYLNLTCIILQNTFLSLIDLLCSVICMCVPKMMRSTEYKPALWIKLLKDKEDTHFDPFFLFL